MKNWLLIFLFLAFNLKGQDTIVITAHSTSDGGYFEERYEYRDSTPYGLIGLQDTYRISEINGKIYFLPGIWAPIEEMPQKEVKKNMPVAQESSSLIEDKESIKENTPSRGESVISYASVREKEKKVEYGISAVCLVLGLLYPFISLIPKIPFLGFFLLLSSLGQAQELVKYRVKAVKEKGQDTFVSAPYYHYKPRDSTVVWIPKVFTPNGDNLHDKFLPVLINCPFFQIDLYTKQGEYLLTLEGSQSWSGMGTTNSYIWLANWKDTKGKSHHSSGIVYELHTENDQSK
jgi:hypothetical protein